MQVFHTQGRTFEDNDLLFKNKMLKVSHDLAFLSPHGRPPHLQMVPSSLVVFFLGTTASMKPLLRPDQISTTAPPTWRARDVGGKRHLWGHWDPIYGWRAGAGLCNERVWRSAQGSFTQVRAAGMRNTLVLLWCVFECS